MVGDFLLWSRATKMRLHKNDNKTENTEKGRLPRLTNDLYLRLKYLMAFWYKDTISFRLYTH